jgi:hypothetical protein
MNQAQKQLKRKPRGKPWPPGVSGNLAGRPQGALNKLSLAVKGEPLAVNRQAGLEQAPPPEPVKYDPRRPHAHTSHKIGGTWRRTVEQEGRIFDRDSGEILNINLSQYLSGAYPSLY